MIRSRSSRSKATYVKRAVELGIGDDGPVSLPEPLPAFVKEPLGSRIRVAQHFTGLQVGRGEVKHGNLVVPSRDDSPQLADFQLVRERRSVWMFAGKAFDSLAEFLRVSPDKLNVTVLVVNREIPAAAAWVAALSDQKGIIVRPVLSLMIRREGGEEVRYGQVQSALELADISLWSVNDQTAEVVRGVLASPCEMRNLERVCPAWGPVHIKALVARLRTLANPICLRVID